MRPVFKEEMKYLGINEKYKDVLWVNSRAYRYFDKEFKIVKLGRGIEKIKFDIRNSITHLELAKKHYEEVVKDKVEEGINNTIEHLKTNKYDEAYVFVSGGKDSTVVEHMLKGVLPYDIMFNNTSNETHHTYQYIKREYPYVKIISPKVGFYKWCKDNIYIPSRTSRGCCSIYKEGQISEYLKDTLRILQITGLRRDESNTRKNYTFNIKNDKWNKVQYKNWDIINPILEFSNIDVWSYIFQHSLNFNTLYKFGYNRVGCANCPFRSSYELELNRHFLPTYNKHWEAVLEYVFKKRKLWTRLYCTVGEFKLNFGGGRAPDRDDPPEEVINEFMSYMKFTREDSMKYFDNSKCDCGKPISSDIISLNRKLNGRNTTQFKCLRCLASDLGVKQKELKGRITEFKEQGCGLF